jgi:alpha-L-rhamnosidase
MKNEILIFALSVLFLQSPLFLPAQNVVRIVNVTTEYKRNPAGISVMHPRLGWELAGSGRDIRQTAWQIRAAASEEDLKAGENLLWDTKKIFSDRSIHNKYEGTPLKSRDKVFWQVKAITNRGETPWSEVASFEMGLLSPSDWKASWIQPDIPEDVSDSSPAPYLRKGFRLRHGIAQARIYASAQGVYQLRLNGEKVSDELFTPGWTSYRNRIQYQIYDITKLVKAGDNVIGIILGDGWFRGYLHAGRNQYGDKLSAILQLEVTYADGGKEMIVTDNGWKSNAGPILKSDIYNGEVYDARRELTGWDQAGYDDAQWKGVMEKNIDKKLLVASESVPVRVTQALHPVKKIITPKKEVVIDFGQNMTGWVAFSLQGKAGDQIKLQFAETLDGAGNFFRDNLRKARAEDVYVFKGGGRETYEPHFTFHGFRYMKIEGYDGEARLEDFVGKVIHSDVTATGRFDCSDAMVNQLVSNIQWSMRGNFLDIPTDSPQRDERLGWTADAQVFAPTACYLADVAAFFGKWMKDLAAEQTPDGNVQDVVPNVRKGNGAAGWGDAATVIPWLLYKVYDDRTVLETQYESMKGWVEYLKAQTKDTYIYHGGRYGDWFAFASGQGDYPGATTDKDLVGTAYFARSTQLLLNVAGVLGKEEDQKRYKELLGNIKAAFQKEFVTPGGRLASNTQTAYVLALAFDLLPEAMRKDAAKRLADDVGKFGHITTGFLGTPEICNVLSRYGYDDAACMLLFRKKYPSWLYPVTMGATTVWERWDSILPNGNFNDGSLNHYAFGAIGNWLFSKVAGISQADDSTGYKRIVIKPHLTEKLSFARAGYHSIHGMISSHWERSGNRFGLRVSIPANTSAKVYMPATEASLVLEGEKSLDKVESVRIAGVEDGWIALEIGSGDYYFSCPLK